MKILKNELPAITGGKPIRESFLPFAQPDIAESDIRSVLKVLKSGWLTTGPETFEFEKWLKKLTGAKYISALSSGTAGLHLALVISKIGPGDEVIVSPLNFASVVNVIIHVRAKPVFVDVEKDTGNIDASLIAEKITKRTKAIIVTHLHGRSADMNGILKLAKKYNLIVIEDAAHALGAVYKGKPIGSIGDFTAFSFYATKNVTTGEGGALATNNKKWADLIEIYKMHGFSRNSWKRYQEQNIKYYQLIYAGFKYNLPDILAALGISQLKRFKSIQKRRKQIWSFYNDQLKDLPLEIPPEEEVNTVHARHIYSITLKLEKLKVTRDQIREVLVKENIGTSVHFISLHLQPYYRKLLDLKGNDFPNALYISERTVSLPLGSNMSNQDAKDVVKAAKKVISFYKK